MRGFLCAELLDFLEGRFGLTAEHLGRPRCTRDTCPGARHARDWAVAAAERGALPAAELLRGFGAASFPRLVRRFPAFLVGVDSTLELLARFDTHIAAEVRKLDAALELPRFQIVRGAGGVAEVRYESAAGLSALAEGLLIGSTRHFEENLEVERCGDAPGAAAAATFRLVPRERHPAARNAIAAARTRFGTPR